MGFLVLQSPVLCAPTALLLLCAGRPRLWSFPVPQSKGCVTHGWIWSCAFLQAILGTSDVLAHLSLTR